MSYDRIHFYDVGRLHDADLPDWYRKAQSLSQTERIHSGLTVGGSIAITPSAK
jgi:hypothetical protein